MTTKPQSYLPPPSQPWGRWVEDTIATDQATLARLNVNTENAIRQLNTSAFQPMRGQLYRTTSFVVDIVTTGVYVPVNAAGTLDADISFNMVASGAPNVTGLKNDTDQTRIVSVVAGWDGKAGNNHLLGIKLAKNGIAIDGSESHFFCGSSAQIAQPVIAWTLRLEPGDEVTMLVANISDNTDITIDRYKMMASAIQ